MANKSIEPKRQSFSWGTIIWIILIFIVLFYWLKGFSSKSANISYSEFIKQVKNNNVSEVTINEQKITGTFKNKYQILKDSKKDTLEFKTFSTIKPAIADPTLISTLEKNNVNINAEESGGGWWKIFLIILIPWILIIGYFAYARRKM